MTIVPISQSPRFSIQATQAVCEKYDDGEIDEDEEQEYQDDEYEDDDDDDDISENTDDTECFDIDVTQEKADTSILKACRELDTATVITFNYSSVSREVAADGICAAVNACDMNCRISDTIRIIKHLQSLHRCITLEIPLLNLITEDHTLVPEPLLNMLVKQITEPSCIVKCLVNSESSLWKRVLQLFIKYKHEISNKELLRIMEKTGSSHPRRLDKIVSIIIRYSLLRVAEEDDEEDRKAFSKLTNVIISTPYMKSLDAILESEHDLTLNLCRFGIFQDQVQSDCCSVVDRLLQNKQILAFYFDIIENLIARNSPIIHSQQMKAILVNAINNK